jgi:hypothetical protein
MDQRAGLQEPISCRIALGRMIYPLLDTVAVSFSVRGTIDLWITVSPR